MKEQIRDIGKLSAEKHAQILASARGIFIKLGFERASVDLIASQAGVSKATVYNHFKDKNALFLQCLREYPKAMEEDISAILRNESGNIEDILQMIGERFLKFLLSPQAMSIHRLFVSEVLRFPELGRAFFEKGPLRMRKKLADFLQLWHDRGKLRIEDPDLAAAQFLTLCHLDLLIRMELRIIPLPTNEEIRSKVQTAVRFFLRGYRP